MAALIPPQARVLASVYKKATSGDTKGAPKPSAFLYAGLGMIALLKDLLDLALIGSFPGIGTVVTACFSFLIWMLMTLFDRSGGKSNSKIARSLVLLFLSLVEAIGFGLNFMPIQTMTVGLLYIMARSAWKKDQARVEQEEAAKRQADQAQAYRLQAQAAQQAQFQEEAANDAQYQKEAANDSKYQNNNVRKIA